MNRPASSKPGTADIPVAAYDPSRPTIAMPTVDGTARPVAQSLTSRLVGCIESRPAAAFMVNLASTAESAARKYLAARDCLLQIYEAEEMNLGAYLRAVAELEDALGAAHRATQFAAGVNREVALGKIKIVGRQPALADRRDREAIQRARHATEHLYDRLEDWDEAWSLVAGGDRLWVHGWQVTYQQLHDVVAAALDWANAAAARGVDRVDPKVVVYDPETGDQWGPSEAAEERKRVGG